ncbi:MAG: hypothetical protein JXX28_10075 [Deltaproteobacteria bacterium]|nr:hypothetical protein [Deltaproteobacteria bacterium]
MIPLLWACLSLAAAPVTVRTWLDGAPSQVGGQLVVQVTAPAGLVLDLSEPEGLGLDLREEGAGRVEALGGEQVITRRYSYSGQAGSYIVEPLVVRWGDGAQQVESQPLYLDLGVEPPRQGALADIVEPPAMWAPPWLLIGAGAALVGSLGLLGYGALRREAPAAAPQAALPPDVAALRAWERARDDEALDLYGKAVAVSRVFRVYAEASLRFPAASWTTGEILAHLGQLQHLPEPNLHRAKRLLRATDRVKYAEQAPGPEFLQDLDADLRAFVAATRPNAGVEVAG